MAGRCCIALAAKIQATFRELRTHYDGRTIVTQLQCLPEDLRPAQGRWRTDFRMDVYRWEGCIYMLKEDGSRMPWRTIGSYSTMTSLLKPGELTMSASGEIGREGED